MAEKVDMSLDDIIKNNKNKTNKNKRGNNKPNIQRLKNIGTRSGLRRGGPKPIAHQQSSPVKGSTKLHVSNLHYNVVDDDIRQLFGELGPLKKATVHYDQSGRSLGTAEIIFATREAALAAIKKYNNVPLDTRPMAITLVPPSTSIRPSAKGRIGVKQNSGVFKRPQVKGPKGTPKGRFNTPRTGKGNFQNRGQRQQRKPVTAEQLDADLEAYSMHVDS